MRLEPLLKATARRLAIPYETVLNDYAIGHLLSTIAQEQALARSLVMKGGTALKKLYFGDFRFSEDLDFTADGGPRGDPLEEAVRRVAAAAQATLSARGPFAVVTERIVLATPTRMIRKASPFAFSFPDSAGRFAL